MGMKSVLNGEMKEAGGPKGMVGLGVIDVRDLAVAHVAAIEQEGAKGKRFIVSSETGHSHLELIDMIRDRVKAYPLPTEQDTMGAESVFKPKYTQERAKDILKLRFRPVASSMRD